MRSTMQEVPLLLSRVLAYGATVHHGSEVVTWTAQGPRRESYAELGRHTARLAHAMRTLGVDADQRVATFMWNNAEHLAAYLRHPLDGRRAAHPEYPAVSRADRLRRQPRRGPRRHRRQLAGRAVRQAAAGHEYGRARRGERAGAAGDPRRAGRHRQDHPRLRGAARRPAGHLRLAGARREHRRGHVLHLRHHRQPQGRRLQPPVQLSALVGADRQRQFRHQAGRPDSCDRAAFPRQRLGNPVRRAAVRRVTGHAGSLPPGRAAGRDDPGGEGQRRRRGAHHLQRPVDLSRRPSRGGRVLSGRRDHRRGARARRR